MNKKRMILWLILIAFTSSCVSEPDPNALKKYGYDISKPDKVYDLISDLNEISGLENIDDSKLLCLHDEGGKLYQVDVQSGESKELFEFGPNDDFEGVTIAGKDAYAVVSNGDIYHIPDFQNFKDKSTIEVYKTDLNKKVDIEGLCYFETTNSLLLAGKGKPDNKGDSDSKVIYSFDLNSKKINNKPHLLIDSKEIIAKLKETTDGVNFGKSSNIIKPSGIAIHPKTNDLYVLSHYNKLLAIYSSDGNLRTVVSISGSRMQQPEGITFTSNGDMFISNEGDGSSQNILKYTYAK